MSRKFLRVVFAAFLIAFCVPASSYAQDDDKIELELDSDQAEEGEEVDEDDVSDDEAAAAAAIEAAEAEAADEAEEVDEPDAEPLFRDQETLAEEEAEEVERLAIDRVPLDQNFSMLRLGIDAVALGGGLTLVLLDGDLLGKEFASMGAPVRGSLDYDVSIAFHGDLQEGSEYLGGASDILGYTLTLGPALFYGVSAGWWALQGETLLGSQTANIDHSFWGYFETMAWTAFFAGALKTFVGRERPYSAFERSAYGDVDAEGFQGGFPSSFASFSFAAAAYVSRDLSAFLDRQDFGFWTSVALPYGLLYGTAAIVSAGRIYQQQAYFSDALVGATIGALVGNLVWIDHFDDDGNPEGSSESDDESVSLAPTLIRDRNEITWGMGVNAMW